MSAAPNDNVEELFRSAQESLLKGDVSKAVTLYQSILRLDPEHGLANYWLGLLELKAGLAEKALPRLRIAVNRHPDFIDCHLDLGFAYRQLALTDQAEACFQAARELFPTYAEFQRQLAQKLEGENRLEDAVEACRRGLLLFPQSPLLLQSLIGLYTRLNRWPDALAAWQMLLQAVPESPQVRLAFAQSCIQAGDFETATDNFRRTLELQPDCITSLVNLALLHHRSSRFDEAIDLFHRALSIDPANGEVYKALGDTFRKLERLEEAQAVWRKSVELKPDYADAWQNLAIGLEIDGKLEEAANCHQRVVDLRPHDAVAIRYLGMVHQDLGHFEQAKQLYERALKLAPKDAETHWQVFSLMACQGLFPEAWQKYEWRWEIKNRTTPKRSFSQPRWGGEDLNGKSILLYSEQGFGDTIQIVRYVSLVSQRGGRVQLWCPPELVSLLRHVEGVSNVFSQLSREIQFDYHLPLMSLPLVFGTTLESIPRSVPYIRSPKEGISKMPVFSKDRLNVGLVWSGSRSQPNDRRPVPFEFLTPLFAVKEVDFYSLQTGAFAGDLERYGVPGRVFDLSSYLSDFANTAAIIMELDLVITIDTSVAHLTGALGRPVWALLSFAPDWRWMSQREDSPWYPTMRLFRQRKPGNWREVIERIKTELERLIRERQSKISWRQLLGEALAHHQAGRLDEAESAYLQVIDTEPNQWDAFRFLGVLERQRGNLAAAQIWSGRAIEAQPRRAEAYHDIGLTFAEAGRLAEAVAAYRKAIEIEPQRPEFHYNLGNAYYASKQFEEAARCYREAVRLDPNFVEAHYNLGSIAQDRGQFPDAADAYRRVLDLEPSHLDALLNLGVALKEACNMEEAEQCFRLLLEAKPDHNKAKVNLASTLAACYSGSPEFSRVEEARQLCVTALEQDPGLSEAWLNLGVIRQAQGNVSDAKRCFGKVLELQPESADGRFNLGVAELLNGEFESGWQNYEARWKTANPIFADRGFSMRQWRGEDLGNATLLVHAEQGMGDAIQFVRYLPLLVPCVKRLVLEVPAPLKRLLASVRGIFEIVDRGGPVPQCDFHIPMMSLPLLMGTTLENIPSRTPYLAAPESGKINPAGSDKGGLRVGLVWAGSPQHAGDRGRSIPFSKISRFLELSKITFFSLQVGPASQHLESLPKAGTMADIGSQLSDFADTAAAIKQLDLVISVDTAVAHLAGALGHEVWVMLPFAPDWRWLLGREDSPWYPTMRLFRQESPGNWDQVIDRVLRALSEHTKMR